MGKRKIGTIKVHPLDAHDVDCRPCDNCCGRRRIAIPADLYDRLKTLKEALELKEGTKIPMCRMVNLLADLICQGLGLVPRRPVSFKAFEEMVSRDILYKSRYTLTRLMDASDPRVAWSFIEVGLRAWFIAVHRFLNAQPRIDAGTYVIEFLEKLNVSNRFMFAWDIRNLLNDEEAVEVVRKEGKSWYAMDILYIKLTHSKECRETHGIRIPHIVSTTMHLPAILTVLWKYHKCLESSPSGVGTVQGLA
jgi:Fe-S-cluster containining protein